ncbi:MAG: aminoglycoside phosphotransferase family protein, partial [Chloroflexota bacterium]
ARLMEARVVRFGGGADIGLFREAARMYTFLPAAPRRVLLHGDFHPRNVLRSERGWLAIDPLPRLGDPSFDAATFLKDEPVNVARVDALSDRLGLEPQRMRCWLFALTVQAASWHLAAGDRARYDAYRSAASVLR